MGDRIKQRLGNISKKKQGGERYEKVQRGIADDDDCDDDELHESELPVLSSDCSSRHTPGGSFLPAWCGSSQLCIFLQAVRDKVNTDVAKSYHEAKRFPVDMYYVFALKFLESYSYFALSQILVLYLHEEFGVADMEAGTVYGM